MRMAPLHTMQAAPASHFDGPRCPRECSEPTPARQFSTRCILLGTVRANQILQSQFTSVVIQSIRNSGTLVQRNRGRRSGVRIEWENNAFLILFLTILAAFWLVVFDGTHIAQAVEKLLMAGWWQGVAGIAQTSRRRTQMG